MKVMGSHPSYLLKYFLLQVKSIWLFLLSSALFFGQHYQAVLPLVEIFAKGPLFLKTGRKSDIEIFP
jgi:hypothetical protein